MADSQPSRAGAIIGAIVAESRDTGSHQSVADTRQKLSGAGAQVEVVMLDRAGHLLPGVDRAAKRQLGAALPEIVGAFIADNG